ncbi:hypothetical protein BCV69DRAFT_292994 [Microstroma glucosiphilum]|uniref:Uncharacterized protein n=1 Tax=Pseudomicrostroma glucosiphilum TaxID=1684307 RepID=A0A316UHC8_9BASI|nr:hypothetical protein BCV69DRAFT_292994 [Pseudomicrostroma glucosiphilum]PWN22595.1 hypothetical protein BCV69DRAFT_292994 [Pseudomicrostroma glucosiphilum]
MAGFSRSATLTDDGRAGHRSSSPWLDRRFSSSGTRAATSSSPSLAAAATAGAAASPSMLGSTGSSLSSASAFSPHSFSPIHPEPDKRGNLEYKLRILPVTPSRFSRLVTQLKWRLAEGGGLAVYEIGVLDDGTLIGLPQDEMRGSLTQLAMMGQALGADCEVRRCILVERGSAPTNDSEEAAAGQSPKLVPYRHKLGTSSKNQSAGLDNIVGLRALDNEEAAKVLGTGDNDQHASSWDFCITNSESEGDEYATGTDGAATSSGGATDTGTPLEEEDKSDEDGFAFSLSLSDDEDLAVRPPAQKVNDKSRRPSRPISNSPWQARTPDFSPTVSRASPVIAAQTRTATASSSGLLPALVEKHLTRDPSCDGPTKSSPPSGSILGLSPKQSSPDAASIDNSFEPRTSSPQFLPPPTQQQHPFTDLAGLDVEGVLRFTLDTRPNAAAKKTKRKSGRRGRVERERVEALLFSDTKVKEEEQPQEASSSSPHPQEPKAPSHSAANHPKQLPTKSQYSRGPRLERRARRLAELKAREREGEGLLFALSSAESDPSPASLEERVKWWRYAGLTFEDELPHYDSVRQAWVREVAEWLTVKEVRDLAECWAPEEVKDALANSDYPESITVEGDVQTPAPTTPAAEADATPCGETQVSRKSANRRKRQERRRAMGQDPEGHRRNNNSAYRPEFAPPPSSAVNIPARNGASTASTGQGGSRSHPLSRSQLSSFSDEDDEEEEDSFGMGLTLNIDETPEGVPATAGNGISTSSDTSTAAPVSVQQALATSPSPSATSTITSLGAGSFSSPETAIAVSGMTSDVARLKRSVQAEISKEDEEDTEKSLESLAASGKMRFIVEAVLSLRLREGEGKAARRGLSNKTARVYEAVVPEAARESAKEEEDDDDDDDDSEGMTGWTLD